MFAHSRVHRRASRRPRLSTPAARVGVFVAVAIGLAALAMLAGRQLVSAPARQPARAPHSTSVPVPRSPSSARPASGGGFEISYPPGWRRLPASDPSVVLFARGPAGASLLVRESRLDAPVLAANLAAARGLTEGLVRRGPGVRMLRSPQRTTVAGLPAYLYLYTFRYSAHERGAHAHYFLFARRTMISIVFQAVPAARILGLAPLFDRVARSLRVLPG